MRPAPSFTLQNDLTNESCSLQQFSGQAVMLTFWTSWCPDSRVDLALKQRLFQAMDQSKMQMLMINVTARERIEDLSAFVHEQGYTFPVLLDEGRTVYDLYKCQGVPTTIFINSQQEIESVLGDQASFQEVTEGLASLLK
ncbi:TlpA family protein disulfide reductase [Alkalicoccobacillus plakortidis]|uniref:TlpA family protein disulfide reductase n=1 Tax=Alkalicoccobacillus plakortidis TaxID=444060 RepID=A0ABT0XET6_9BACI|nr:TlpA disulfide reductase family protein [Alkalicoccobacillus plakortidis]MCM2674387.1 TlpA family protein disulfide reductase [Alkalicoccobacillus plakortidis]